MPCIIDIVCCQLNIPSSHSRGRTGGRETKLEVTQQTVPHHKQMDGFTSPISDKLSEPLEGRPLHSQPATLLSHNFIPLQLLHILPWSASAGSNK